MAIKTTEGTPATEIGPWGVREWTTDDLLTADGLNRAHRDLQGPLVQLLSPGALAPIVCTAAGLVLSVPSGSKWFARQMFVLDANAAINVPASSTLYLWGCSDGVLRLDASSSASTGFPTSSAARIVKVTSSGSALTLDYTVQQRARFASDLVPSGGGAFPGSSPIYPPVLGDWGWVVQGSSTLAQNGESLRLASQAGTGGGDKMYVLSHAYPATTPPWDLRIALTYRLFAANYNAVGFGIRDSTTGRIEAIHIGRDAAAFSGGFVARMIRWDDTDDFNAYVGPYSPVNLSDSAPRWLHLNRTGTAHSYYISENGMAETQLGSGNMADFVSAPDQIVLYANVNGTTEQVVIDLWSYRQG